MFLLPQILIMTTIPVERVPGTWCRWGILVGMDCTNHALQREEDDSDAKTVFDKIKIL